MLENLLWIAVALMLVSAVSPKKARTGKLIGGAGWGFFSVHWLYQPVYYAGINDYFNVVLTILLAIFCIFVAYMMAVREYIHDENVNSKVSVDVTHMATAATAIGSLMYFPFAQMQSMDVWLISIVTDHTVWALQLLGYPAVLTSWDIINLNEYSVRIVLACTAIESIALFTGLILSVRAPAIRLVSAFLVSVPVIYVLNIARNVFVTVAYAGQWFGPNSFEIAHHFVAKAGSVIALLIIAYMVLKILPELIELIDGLREMGTEQLQIIFNRISGKQ
ncbi:Exosortase EpsH-related protein [Methanosalsum zhilinae DSM 4017]|uniref:Exosortase EpsH-related protein n=1 Tax=Methanosalsum zhilinae (strain DSM 4017 / NBRC 107636 / OCM 62 / WeN5) TaxID=679901 RepID=F7XM60_METZD|nr:archaeosortase A [Methanosalsum zhilinae]AEH61516.1 Exosortase EpsH-related protein [Methanosalsum zhilinae DSM 4017]